MKLYKTTKQVLSVRNKPQQFLNGLTTNSLDKPHNAFVNLSGRIIATFSQLQISDDEVLLVIEKDFVPNVIEHVDRYARLSKVIIEVKDLLVYFDFENSYKALSDDFVIAQKSGQLVLTSKVSPTLISEDDFTIFRVNNNIPVQGIDYKDEMILNVSETDFVSFTKGCFLGQEPLAKVHHRSKPTWKLIVKVQDECTPEEKAKLTSPILDPVSSQIKGFVFAANQ